MVYNEWMHGFNQIKAKKKQKKKHSNAFNEN